MKLTTDTKRPYRFNCPNLKRRLKWRYFLSLWSALNKALIDISWWKVGMTIEVIDITRGDELLASFTMLADGRVRRWISDKAMRQVNKEIEYYEI